MDELYKAVNDYYPHEFRPDQDWLNPQANLEEFPNLREDIIESMRDYELFYEHPLLPSDEYL